MAFLTAEETGEREKNVGPVIGPESGDAQVDGALQVEFGIFGVAVASSAESVGDGERH